MKYPLFASALLLSAVLIGAPTVAQGACRTSCTNLKNSCMNTGKSGVVVCNARFGECLNTGSWVRSDRRGSDIFRNICKR
jgi:hypothetical protein